MRKVTANEIFQMLTEEERIKEQTGRIEFSLGNLSVRVATKDTVGNLLQEWVKEWLDVNGIEYGETPQTFPDFFLDVENKNQGLMELKTFDSERGPGFDIANFDAYCTSLLTQAYRLDSDYLIFSYRMEENGDISIKDIWLKKIWEIAGASGTYPIKVQEKKNIIYNIRPIKWFDNGRCKYKPFTSKEEFLCALNNTRYQYTATRAANSHWLQNVIRNYQEHTGILLDVPNR